MFVCRVGRAAENHECCMSSVSIGRPSPPAIRRTSLSGDSRTTAASLPGTVRRFWAGIAAKRLRRTRNSATHASLDRKPIAVCSTRHLDALGLVGASEGPLAALTAAIKDAGERTGGGNPEWLEAQQPAGRTTGAVQKPMPARRSLVRPFATNFSTASPALTRITGPRSTREPPIAYREGRRADRLRLLPRARAISP
jgi:hypothetical protein